MDDQPEKIACGLINQLEDSWNAADGEAFGEAFTEDADFVAIRGDYHQRREAIARGHHAIFNSIYKGSRVSLRTAPGASTIGRRHNCPDEG